MRRLCSTGRDMGISFNPNPVGIFYFRDGQDVEAYFAKLQNDRPNLQLVLAVLGRRGQGISYGV